MLIRFIQHHLSTYYPLTPIYLIESNNTNGAHKRIFPMLWLLYYMFVYIYCHIYTQSKLICRVAWERIRYIHIKDFGFRGNEFEKKNRYKHLEFVVREIYARN